MANQLSGYVQVLYTQNILENGIVFECRSFNKELHLPYMDLVFIPESFVRNNIPDFNSRCVLNPKEINPLYIKGKYFELGLLVNSLEIMQISTLLVSIMESTESFYEINSIFKYFCRVSFDKNQIGRVCKMLIHCDFVRRSFSAQSQMSSFLEKHNELIEPDIIYTLKYIYSHPPIKGAIDKIL